MAESDTAYYTYSMPVMVASVALLWFVARPTGSAAGQAGKQQRDGLRLAPEQDAVKMHSNLSFACAQ